NLQILTIRELQSNDSGVYECETLGAIRQFNLIVMGKFPLFPLLIIFISREILC
ncbi:unnamed protein product, partial [Rotaria magnacalcarata]